MSYPTAARISEHDRGLECYFQKVSQSSLLNAQDEFCLGVRVQRGCPEAFRQMTLANLRLVVYVAKQYRHRGVPLSDLIEEGNLGLMKAVQCFDPHRGFRFSTYAVWLIRQAMERAVRELSRDIRLPEQVENQIKKQTKGEWGDTPATGHDSALIPHIPISIDAPISDEHLVSIVEVLPAPQTTEEVEANHDEITELVSLCLNYIPPRDAMILRHRFGIQGYELLTLKEIGERLNVSHERVRQLENQVLQKLHHFLSTMHIAPSDLFSA